MYKKILGFIALFFFILAMDTKSNSSPSTDSSPQYYTIDGFEIPGEWVAHFSKYRSRKWNKKEETPGDKAREEDRLWYDWFTADETNFTAKELLPDFIVKNSKLHQFEKEKTIFGVKARWDFHGFNWVSIEPNNVTGAGPATRYSANKLGRYTDQIVNNDSFDDQEYVDYDGGSYILLPGQTQEIGIFVWGNSCDYTMEFHVEDFNGSLYILSGGSLLFKGWHTVNVTVPGYIRQISSSMPRVKPLKLKRLKMVLNPKERIAGTYHYFDYLHGKTDTYKESFFGEGLENSQRIWKRNKEKGSTPTKGTSSK